jgi:hypothetical protein
MRSLPAMVSVVERARNEPDELKYSHETVISALTPFLTPALAVQELSFIKSCTGIKYAAFSVDYFTSVQLDLIRCIQTDLGCKIRRNSGRNGRIPLRFGDFAPGTTEFTICTFRFFPVFSLYVTEAYRTFCTTPPHCKACLGPSERAYLSRFGLRDPWGSCFRGS